MSMHYIKVHLELTLHILLQFLLQEKSLGLIWTSLDISNISIRIWFGLILKDSAAYIYNIF